MVKKSAYQCRRGKRLGFDPWVSKISWSRRWQPIPVFLPGKFHGQRSLVGYSPWGCKESDVTEHSTQKDIEVNSLAGQWLELHAFTVEGRGSILVEELRPY